MLAGMSRAHRTTAAFTVTAWDEQIVTDIDGNGFERGGTYYPSLGITASRVTYTYSGGLEGVGTVAYAFTYRQGASPIVGFERFEGSLDGHDGSFVLQHAGHHTVTGVQATMTVLEGMGTGGLETLRGEAHIDLEVNVHGGFALVLDYDL